MKSLPRRVQNALKVLDKSRRRQSKSLWSRCRPITIDVASFIDLVNAGAKKLTFEKYINIGGKRHYAYSAMYRFKKIVTVSDTIIYKL